MNWATHPLAYQITHWIHWLGYGQNAAALQALVAVIATAAAIAAALYAKRAYEETREQVRIAQHQLKLAAENANQDRERFELEKASHLRAEAQFHMMQEEFGARMEELQRGRAAEQRAIADAKRRQAVEEEQTRATFRSDYMGSVRQGFDISIRNLGQSPALEVACLDGAGERLMASAEKLHRGQALQFQGTIAHIEDGLIIQFKTELGTSYRVSLLPGRTPEEVVLDRSPA